MDMIIKNGTVVTDSEMFKADIAVKEGKVQNPVWSFRCTYIKIWSNFTGN